MRCGFSDPEERSELRAVAAAVPRRGRAQRGGDGAEHGPVAQPHHLQQRGCQGGAREEGPAGRRVPRHAPLQRTHHQHGRPVGGNARRHFARLDSLNCSY